MAKFYDVELGSGKYKRTVKHRAGLFIALYGSLNKAKRYAKALNKTNPTNKVSGKREYFCARYVGDNVKLVFKRNANAYVPQRFGRIYGVEGCKRKGG